MAVDGQPSARWMTGSLNAIEGDIAWISGEGTTRPESIGAMEVQSKVGSYGSEGFLIGGLAGLAFGALGPGGLAMSLRF